MTPYTTDQKSYRKMIFAAMAKENFFSREYIMKYILQQGYTPSSAFMMFSYFLLDTVERQALICANNELIRRSDELWVFGRISDGVAEEIKVALIEKLPIKYFKFDANVRIFQEITENDALMLA